MFNLHINLMPEKNIVYIGQKPAMTYVLAVLANFSEKVETVTLRARGRLIPKAVDTAQIAVRRFLPNVGVESVSIGTDVSEGDKGTYRKSVSKIEIGLSKDYKGETKTKDLADGIIRPRRF